MRTTRGTGIKVPKTPIFDIAQSIDLVKNFSSSLKTQIGSPIPISISSSIATEILLVCFKQKINFSLVFVRIQCANALRINPVVLVLITSIKP